MLSTSLLSIVVNILHQWFLPVLFFVEILIKLGVNNAYLMGGVEKQTQFDDISQAQRDSALGIAGLTFGAIALVLSENPTDYLSQMELFSVAFGYLLAAVFLHELTLNKRVFLTIQEMCFEYGLLIMFWGLYLLINDIAPKANSTVFWAFTLVAAVRFYSSIKEIQAHWNTDAS